MNEKKSKKIEKVVDNILRICDRRGLPLCPDFASGLFLCGNSAEIPQNHRCSMVYTLLIYVAILVGPNSVFPIAKGEIEVTGDKQACENRGKKVSHEIIQSYAKDKLIGVVVHDCTLKGLDT